MPYVEDSTEEPPLPSPRPPLPEIMPLSNSEIPVLEDMQVQFINEASSAGNLDLSTFLLKTPCSTLPGANGAANSFHDLLVTCPAHVQCNIPDEEPFNEVKASSVSQKILPKDKMVGKSVRGTQSKEGLAALSQWPCKGSKESLWQVCCQYQ